MKKWIYSQHNLQAGFYNPLQVSELDPQTFSKSVERSIITCNDPSKLINLVGTTTEVIGSYDDETMKFELLDAPEVILDCDSLVAPKINSHYGKQSN